MCIRPTCLPFPRAPMEILFETPFLSLNVALQVFKNSCRAVVERHADGFDDPLPSVHCHIVHGYEDVTPLGRRRCTDFSGRRCHATIAIGWGFGRVLFSPFARENVSSTCQLKKSGRMFLKPSFDFSSRFFVFF